MVLIQSGVPGDAPDIHEVYYVIELLVILGLAILVWNLIKRWIK